METERTNFRVGRVLHEDDEYLTLEIPKDMHKSITLEDGDRFLTLIFVHVSETGTVETWVPWEET
jgi:hypothetical protein